MRCHRGDPTGSLKKSQPKGWGKKSSTYCWGGAYEAEEKEALKKKKERKGMNKELKKGQNGVKEEVETNSWEIVEKGRL